MSLYEEKMEDFVIMDKTTVPDGEGGVTTEWTEGAVVKAAVTKDNSMVAKIAEKQGVTSVYSIYTKKSVVFNFHDVIKRVRDSYIFRITSNGIDEATPQSATLDMRKVTAEEWKL